MAMDFRSMMALNDLLAPSSGSNGHHDDDLPAGGASSRSSSFTPATIAAAGSRATTTTQKSGAAAAGNTAVVVRGNTAATTATPTATPSSTAPSTSASSRETKKKDPNDIWDDDEVPYADELVQDFTDTRKSPDYEIIYKQHVSSEDVYLNRGFKDASSAFCDWIVVRVSMPGTKLADVTLDVTPDRLQATTAIFRLFLHLPHRVDSDKGRAQWDTKKSALVVTLPIVRDES